eukprot:177183_1
MSLPLCAIVGVLMNPAHMFKMDTVMSNMDIVSQTSQSTAVIHIGVKMPFPLKARDFVNVAMLYFFKDGSCLMGSSSCKDETLLRNDKDYVRATITLSMYHIRPHYDGNMNKT